MLKDTIAFALIVTAIIAVWTVTPANAFDNREGLRAWERQTDANERMLAETQSQLNRMQERAFDDMRDMHYRNRTRNGY